MNFSSSVTIGISGNLVSASQSQQQPQGRSKPSSPNKKLSKEMSQMSSSHSSSSSSSTKRTWFYPGMLRPRLLQRQDQQQDNKSSEPLRNTSVEEVDEDENDVFANEQEVEVTKFMRSTAVDAASQQQTRTTPLGIRERFQKLHIIGRKNQSVDSKQQHDTPSAVNLTTLAPQTSQGTANTRSIRSGFSFSSLLSSRRRLSSSSRSLNYTNTSSAAMMMTSISHANNDTNPHNIIETSTQFPIQEEDNISVEDENDEEQEEDDEPFLEPTDASASIILIGSQLRRSYQYISPLKDADDIIIQEDDLNRRHSTSDVPELRTLISSSDCPTTRFFATSNSRMSSSSTSSKTIVGDISSTSSDNECYVKELQLNDNCGQSGIYTGTVDKETRKPHGQGIMCYTHCKSQTKEDIVEASEHNPQEEQASTSTPPIVLIYNGQWHQGDWCGFGTLQDIQHGHTYEGGFFDNYKHGLGVLQYADGRIYDGIFALGKLEGKGHLIYPNGTKYWGHWTQDGIEHGRGKKVFVDGRIYDGEFIEGVLHGHGRMTYPDGSWYLGEWMDDERNGLGIEVLPDGSLRYEGTFYHDKPIEGSSFPTCQKKSEGDFLLYRSSIARHGGTLVGNIPKQVFMRKDKMKWAGLNHGVYEEFHNNNSIE